MTSRRILHVLSGFHLAGIENLALQLIRNTPTDLTSFLLNIDPSSTKLLPSFEQLISSGNLRAIYQISSSGITLFLRIIFWSKSAQFDSIIVYPCNFSLLWLITAFRFHGSKLIAVCVQNAAPTSTIKRFKWACLLRTLIFLHVDLVCCSNAVAESLKGLLPVNYICKIIPNGCATDLISSRSLNTVVLSSKSNTFKVMMVARLDQIKDQATLIKAFAHASNPEWELYFVGDGPTRNYLECLAANHELASVFFLGNRLDIPELLGSVDCFAFSTTPSEGFGIALIEAMAAGLPVIASDVPACREVLDNGRCGLLLPPGNHELFASSLHQIYSDDSLRNSLSRLSIQRSKYYDIKNVANSWYDLLSK